MAALARLLAEPGQDVFQPQTMSVTHVAVLTTWIAQKAGARERSTLNVRVARALAGGRLWRPRGVLWLSVSMCCDDGLSHQDDGVDRTLAHVVGRNTKFTIAQRLEIGSRVAEIIAADGDLCHRKWRHIAEAHFHLRYTAVVAGRLHRCLKEWHNHGAGAYTLSGSGGVSPGGVACVNARARCRRISARPRGRNMACLWFELLQWYVDEVEALRSRADSALSLKQAQLIRDRLQEQGHQAACLPKVDKDCLRRWRLEYGLSVRATTFRMKVSMAKAMDRVKVMLSNISSPPPLEQVLWRRHCHAVGQLRPEAQLVQQCRLETAIRPEGVPPRRRQRGSSRHTPAVHCDDNCAVMAQRSRRRPSQYCSAFQGGQWSPSLGPPRACV